MWRLRRREHVVGPEVHARRRADADPESGIEGNAPIGVTVTLPVPTRPWGDYWEIAEAWW